MSNGNKRTLDLVSSMTVISQTETLEPADLSVAYTRESSDYGGKNDFGGNLAHYRTKARQLRTFKFI